LTGYGKAVRNRPDPDPQHCPDQQSLQITGAEISASVLLSTGTVAVLCIGFNGKFKFSDYPYLILADDDGLHGLHNVDAACASLGTDNPVCAGQVHVPVINKEQTITGWFFLI
jgi:hypothetical protein